MCDKHTQNIPTLESVEIALKRVCESTTLGARDRGYTPSRWVALACEQLSGKGQATVLKLLKQLERRGIAVRVPGKMEHNGSIYSKWWHKEVAKPVA